LLAPMTNGTSSVAALPMRRPLISLSIGFAAGILVQHLAHPNIDTVWIICGCSALGASVLALLRLGGELRFFLWLISFCALGCARGTVAPRPSPSPPPSGRVVVDGTARSVWRTTPDSARLDIELHSLGTLGEEEQEARGRARLTVWKEPLDRTTDTRTQPWPCPSVLPGDRLRMFATLHLPRSQHNPGMPDRTQYLVQDEIDLVGTIESCADVLPITSKPHASFQRAIESWRLSIADFMHRRVGDPGAIAILLSQTNGDQGAIPKPLYERFQTSGLAHILSISGLHLGIVAGGLYWLLTRLLLLSSWLTLRWDVRRIAASLTIPITILYTLLAGAQVPAVRSCMMVLCFLLAVIIRRESDPLHTLAAAALVILGVFPQSLFSISFQLSFVAVLSMLLGVGALERLFHVPQECTLKAWSWWRRLPVRALQYILVSLAATVGTAPLVAWHFNQISLIGPVANLLAVPLSTVLIVPVGLLCVVLLPLSQTAAGWVADIGVLLSSFLASLAQWFGGLPMASIHVPTPPVITLVLCYAVMILVLMIGRWRRAGLAALAGAIVLILIACWGYLAPRFSHELRVTFIDVGQGDSILLRCPGGESWLIDGGSKNDRFDAGRQVVAPFLWNQQITHLDGVIGSHFHPDHIGGLPSVVTLFQPKEIWLPEDWRDNPAAAELRAAAELVGAPMKIVTAGDTPTTGRACGFEVLWPSADTAMLEENDRSLVLRATSGKRTFLFVGDLQAEGEKELLKRQSALEADVLKAGHHGSSGASSKEFLDAVKPAWVVISVGPDNVYHFPHQQTLERLATINAATVRTDKNGAVTCHTDGEDLTCTTVLHGLLSPQ
jgi:competence protein ComEC